MWKKSERNGTSENNDVTTKVNLHHGDIMNKKRKRR